ncbi:APC family permease [Sporolactobacillus pectinivorans]|uniref:APC family permease n=1 Tax=Sporolactobacillus pectinivorans TaxID=1591408 RepID=UPI000C259200|nr:APC family permease [Sporolactobacillus pectinivorans]
MGEKKTLKKNQLNFLEVIALSIAILAPTFASSMNFGLIASSASYSVSLVFIISVIALLLVSVAFVKFGKEFVSAGSAYTYVEAGLGNKFGAISGWALLLTYAGYTSGCSSAFGYLFSDFIRQLTGINIPWVIFALLSLLLIWYITYYDIKVSTRIMLFIEIFSVLLVLGIAIVVLIRVGTTTGLSAAPFKFSNGSSLNGIGAGMVAAILSFAGFEGAASLGEESRNPKKYIPVAILSTVIFAGVIYIFVSFAEINGFGVTSAGLKAFTSSGSTIVELSNKYAGAVFTVIITFAISISAFSTALGSSTASSRALYQLAKDGKVPSLFGKVHEKHNTPYIADSVITIASVIPIIALYFGSGLQIDGFTVFYYIGTIGTLGLIVVYLLTCISSVAYFGFNKKVWTWQNIAPIVGGLLLLYVLWANVSPSALSYPFNIFPYIALAFIAIGSIYTYYYQKGSRVAADQSNITN